MVFPRAGSLVRACVAGVLSISDPGCQLMGLSVGIACLEL